MCRLQTSTASCVIEHLKPIYARHGIPDILVADNMPFASSEMRTFAAEWDFEIKPSSPEYPQSNGQSERMIGTVKQLMRKALEESKDTWHYLNIVIRPWQASSTRLHNYL